MTRRAPVAALVQVGAVETRYLRAGRGAPVVLLTDSEPGSARDAALFATLAAHWTVVWVDAGRIRALGWLVDLVEGLGFERAALVLVGERDGWPRSVAAEVRAVGLPLGPVLEIDGGTSDADRIPQRLRSALLEEQIAARGH